MSDPTHDVPSRGGETGGTAQRPAHQFAAPALAFDLGAEIERLRHEESYRRGDRNSKTLVKEPRLRLGLIALKAGARIREHQAAGPTTVQTLEGHIRLRIPQGFAELPVGHLLTIEANVPHDVEAEADSAFLLTIAWAEERHA